VSGDLPLLTQDLLFVITHSAIPDWLFTGETAGGANDVEAATLEQDERVLIVEVRAQVHKEGYPI